MTARTPQSIYASFTPPQMALYHSMLQRTRARFMRSGFAAGVFAGAGLSALIVLCSYC